jgi:hypothetical protein
MSVSISRGFRDIDADKPDEVRITLKEASFIKLFCDAYFIRKVRPRALDALSKAATDIVASSPAEPRS